MIESVLHCGRARCLEAYLSELCRGRSGRRERVVAVDASLGRCANRNREKKRAAKCADDPHAHRRE